MSEHADSDPPPLAGDHDSIRLATTDRPSYGSLGDDVDDAVLDGPTNGPSPERDCE